MDQTIVIDRRFNGPRLSGNGGYVAGLLAQHVDPRGAVEVTLRAGVPLDTPLRLRRGDDGSYALTDGGQLVCEARAATLDLQPPELQPWMINAPVAPDAGSDTDSDFHWCFVCGRGRAVGDGLRVFGQRVAGKPMSLAPYRAHQAHAEADGRISPAHLWGALDCPGAWAAQDADDTRPSLTGRMTGQVLHRPAAGKDCLVVGWRIGAEGRKLYAGTALYTRAGTLCAVALTTWIVLA
ncbi:MAG TPA: hypothetical protein VJ890_15580 [Vineibacter sp.]|nr:hypothetical protein [Vineibacter sp.]